MGCLHAGAALSERFRASDYVTGHAFRICRCADCGLDVTFPAPAELGAYYPQAYYGVDGARRFPAAVEWGQRLLYGLRVRAIERLAGGHAGRVLDVGCGPGALLQAFRRRGWDAHGTELSDGAAARARAVGIPVHVGPIGTWPWPPGHFDAVTMWHALEHWPDPHAVVAEVARLLRGGGVFMVGVPNIGSVEAHLARDGWFHLDVPRHLVHFTPRTLDRVLAASGLVAERRSFLAPEYDTFSFVQSALNRAGLPRNLLYDVLRGRGAKLGSGRGAIAKAATLLLAVPLGVVSVPVTALLGLAGRGSSLTVFARKAPALRPRGHSAEAPG